MLTNTYKILSVVPGTWYLGVAIFHDTDLMDWRIKYMPGASVEEKMVQVKSLVSDFIDRHGITVLALKKVHPSRSSETLSGLHTEIKKFGKSKNLIQLEFTIDKIKQSLIQQKGNKKILMEELTANYPALSHLMEQMKANESVYLMRAFEAVAQGVAALDHLENNHKRS
jgi:hypothetical protein